MRFASCSKCVEPPSTCDIRSINPFSSVWYHLGCASCPRYCSQRALMSVDSSQRQNCRQCLTGSGKHGGAGGAMNLRVHATVWSFLLSSPMMAFALDTDSLVPVYLSRLEHPGRVLRQGAVPDCGRAFQPCCSSGDVCKDPSLSCIAREPLPRCEPCGTPFAQPCPTSPYCEAEGLIPTTRRSDINIQCRPCGSEWQPCCAVLGSLCTGGFTCYAEQDRCVVTEYTYVKEEFFPDLIPVGPSASPICGGLNDPPCMEPSPRGPTWQCDDGLVTHIPVFLCMTDTTEKAQTMEGCGSNLQHPCTDGCMEGLTLVVDLARNDAGLPDPMPAAEVPASRPPPQVIPAPVSPDSPSTSTPSPAPEQENDTGICGVIGATPCASGCTCGLRVGADGACVEDLAGCLDSDGVVVEFPVNQTSSGPTAPPEARSDSNPDEIVDQSSDGAADAAVCGLLNAGPCTAVRVQPCQCGLYLDESTGKCAAEISSGPCPVRPYCGFDGGPPCSFPGDQPCDECLEVEAVSATCIRNPFCVREDAISDQSFRCGRQDAMPCATPPLCRKNLAVGDNGLCVRCGHQAGAVPCTTNPACKGRRTANVEGIDSETCKDCGGEGEPPCSDKLSEPPCDKGLFRLAITPGDERSTVTGQLSVCTSQEVTDQCGFVGQKPCEGVCLGRSVPSEKGDICKECGSASQGICDGPGQDHCDVGLEEYQSPGETPVCLCPDSGCAGPSACNDDDAIIDQTGPGIGAPQDSEDDCGLPGQPRCLEEPYCEDRLLADEDGICHPCGESEGAVPCPEEPQCEYRLSLSPVGDFCTACGGSEDPVCCDGNVCSQDDPFDTPCDAGLLPVGVQVQTDVELRSQTAEAYCSSAVKSKRCGVVGEPPCEVEDTVDKRGNPARPCRGLSTPSPDGLKCIPCGKAGQPACVNRFKICTGKLIAVFDDNKPNMCMERTRGQGGGVADQAADSLACGKAGLPWCKGTPTPCIGRTIVAAGEFCAECGAAGQFACTEGSPCDGLLRHYRNKCIACGGANEVVCGRAGMGEPCNEGLKAVRGKCMADATRNVEDQSIDGSTDGTDHKNGMHQCGRNGTQPCPGQPACGKNLYLIKDKGQIICSDNQPTNRYPQGDDCGGIGQPLCNEAPHCQAGLVVVLPEGICITQEPQAATCGSLGNMPCEDGVKCQPGLSVRSGEKICGPSEDVPCGIRGFPICVGEQALCSQLLYPTFPEMICIDSARTRSPQPCGVLGSTACIGLACTSPLVVQPSTAVCVPSESVPCGGLEQSQCFWDGRRPCVEGLFSENGICRQE